MGVKVRERPAGSGIWWVFINYQGQRKAKKVGPEDLANKVAEQIHARLVLGEYDFDENEAFCPTLKQYVYGWTGPDGQVNIGWLDKYARLSLKKSTGNVYENLLRVHIIPEFGKLSLDQITSRMIGEFIVKKFDQDLRSQTVKNLKNCLGSVLRYAHRPDGYLDSSPAKGIVVPRPVDEKPTRVPDPFTWEDREFFEKCFLDHFPKYYPILVTGFRTGLRMGELLALQWQDIDFKHRLIYVNRNITVGSITTPKSRAGVRQVRMTTQLVAEFKLLQKVRKEDTLKYGWAETPPWLFCDDEGSFLSYDFFLKRVWNRAMEKSGLRRRTPHDMRHTYATLRLSKGDSLAEVSKEMGHSSSDITYRTYYKWLPKESLTDIDELDNPQPSATYTQPAIKKELAT
jgi:integrase